ncbi:MAG: PDZ domain-containing protein [Chloroflexaceae bacterium]
MEYQPDIKRITGEGGLIVAVAPGSIAAEIGLKPGDVLVAVGGQRLRDVIDYRFAIAEEHLELLVHSGDNELVIEVEKDPDRIWGFSSASRCSTACAPATTSAPSAS